MVVLLVGEGELARTTPRQGDGLALDSTFEEDKSTSTVCTQDSLTHKSNYI